MTTYPLDLMLYVAEGAARAAGAILRRKYDLPRNVRDKHLNDLVTDADTESEALCRAVLRAAFPDHNIAGEEEGEDLRYPDAPTWWIDPLDGTYNFVHGVPRFSVSIACLAPDDQVLVGAVCDPMFGETFTAAAGHGAHCNGRPIRVSETSQLRSALVASGFPANLRTTDNNTAEWAAFVSRTQGVARMGSAALDLSYVACGRFDVFWEYGLAEWDMSAGVLIVREAGGTVTHYDGSPFDLHKHGGLLSSNSLLHAEAISVLQSVRNS